MLTPRGQLHLDGLLPLHPRELAGMTAPERSRRYTALGLDYFQRQAAEEAVRRVIAGKYRKSTR
jgi:hypothetical protein